MKTHRLFLWSGLAALLSGAAAFSAADAVEPRIEELLGQLTLEEKIHLLSGDSTDFNAQGLPRLAIPSIRMGDGPLLHDYFGRTRAIRRGIIDAGQDTAARQDIAE